jgi:hypothetical protein
LLTGFLDGKAQEGGWAILVMEGTAANDGTSDSIITRECTGSKEAVGYSCSVYFYYYYYYYYFLNPTSQKACALMLAKLWSLMVLNLAFILYCTILPIHFQVTNHL